MRALVVGTPKFPVPPEELSGMFDAALAWYERHRASLEVFGTFVGGGGFAVVDVADEEALNQMVLEMPFSRVSDVQVRPFVTGDAGLRQAQAALAAARGETAQAPRVPHSQIP